MTPMDAAATWASREVVETMHTAPSPPHLPTTSLFPPLSLFKVVEALFAAGSRVGINGACGVQLCHCTGAVMGQRPDNLRLILEREPHIATATSQAPSRMREAPFSYQMV